MFLPATILVLNLGIVLERTADDTILFLAESESSVVLSLVGVGALGGFGWIVSRSVNY